MSHGILTPGKKPTGPTDDAFARRVFDLLDLLQDWAGSHRDRLGVCSLGFDADGFELTAVGKSERFDYALNEDLSNFAVALTAKGFKVAAQLFPAGSESPSAETGPRIRIVSD
jgi:hypothetical protein